GDLWACFLTLGPKARIWCVKPISTRSAQLHLTKIHFSPAKRLSVRTRASLVHRPLLAARRSAVEQRLILPWLAAPILILSVPSWVMVTSLAAKTAPLP